MTAPDPYREAGRRHWHRQPVLWLGVALFVLSMAGCIWIIVAGSRHTDEALETGRTVFGVPVSSHSSAHSPSTSPEP